MVYISALDHSTSFNKDNYMACSDTFYRKGIWRGEKVFERNAQGEVVKLLDRRENNDIVWKKSN